MNYSLCNRLGRGARSQDPSAADYIALVRAAGATVDSNQVGEINNFYRTAKSTGYYTSLKRLYLPIWGVAAANAIDMIGGTSGTFSGGVTHGEGFVQGNGSTGYFTSNISASAVGMTSTSGLAGVVVYTADTRNALKCLFGTRNDDASGSVLCYQTDSSNLLSVIGRTGASAEPNSTLAATPNGVILANRNTTDLQVHRRNSSAFSSGTTEITTGATITSLNQRFMALWETTTFFHTDAKIGAMFMGLGLSDSTAETFSSHIKTLWEGCTQLSLP